MSNAPIFQWGLSGKKYTDPGQFQATELLGPAVKVVQLPTDGTTFNPPKWFIGDKGGTATITDASGDAALTNFPVTGGEQHVAITSITALSTTTTVWGGY